MSLSLTITILLTCLWAIITGSGFVLLLLGLRGRQADFMPRCRNCRYVIDGGFDPARCSECGAHLAETGTLRIGRRRLNETPLVFGIILLVLGITPVIALSVRTNAPNVIATVAAPLGAANSAAIATQPAPLDNRFTPHQLIVPQNNARDSFNALRLSHAGVLDQTMLEAGWIPDTFAAASEADPEHPATVLAGISSADSNNVQRIDSNESRTSIQSAEYFTQPALYSVVLQSDAYDDFPVGPTSSIELAPLVPALKPLVPQVRELHVPAVNHYPVSITYAWTPSQVKLQEPVDTRLKSSAVKPPRLRRR